MSSNNTNPVASTSSVTLLKAGPRSKASRWARHSRGKKFLSYYKPYLGLFLADIACALIVSAVTLLLPLCAQYITQNILGGNDPHELRDIVRVGVFMLILVAIQTLSTLFIDFQGHMMGTRMQRDMRTELFAHYQKLSFSFYDEQKVGQLMTRITDDTFWLSELYHHGPEDIVVTFLTVTGVFIILAKINFALTLVLFLFLPLMTAYALYFNKRMNRALRSSKDRIGDINAQVEDTLAGIRVVKSFTNEEVENHKFASANRRFLASRSDGYKSDSLFFAGLGAFAQLMTIAVIILGGIAIVHAALDLADMLTYLLCVGILIDPIKKLINFGELYQEGITGFQRFMEILEIEPDIQDTPGACELTSVRGDIEFHNVSFRYKENQQDVVKNLSLRIAAGEYVALVGPSGSGKTTLCSLIPRFYDVNAGNILLDGHDIRAVTLRSLRRNIGIVQQDIYLFAGTIAENIGYGKLDASKQEIIAAAKKAHAHDFIMALPAGYDTDIGQRGVKLSGGQKQRLSIARVFLKDPAVIIFDEATSALDNESERAVQNAMEKFANKCTTLVIAHRLSTIRNAHRIVVLSEHGISEQGTHEELIALNGTYAQLCNTQAKI